MHYSTIGKAASDRTKIGLVFAREPVTEQIVSMMATPSVLRIPPQIADYQVNGLARLRTDAKLVSMRPHMHVRGKSFEFRAVYPDGTSELLLNVPKFDFNWQPYYYLEDPKPFPAGTRIEVIAHFDNSSNNPFNPDPSVTVLWGPQTWDEMMIGWFDVAMPASATDASNQSF
jgi:hypothetical protein